MFTVFKSGFKISDRRSLNSFASQVVKYSEDYIKYLIYTGRIIAPDNMSAFDIAVDLMGELFKTENGYLIHFKNYYEKIDDFPETEADFNETLKRFVISITQNNLPQIFRRTDPITNKLIRNIKTAIKNENYIVTQLFSDQYIHRKPVDFESAECIEKEKLLTLIFNENGVKEHSAKDLLTLIFNIIEMQTEYLHAIPFNDLIQIFKDITALDLRYNLSCDESESEVETKFHLKLLFDKISKGFNIKLNKYFKKKNFSEKECECIYNIVDDVINCYASGCERESVNDLILKHYSGEGTKSFFNKVEYVIELLNNEIISELKKEDNINVKLLSK